MWKLKRSRLGCMCCCPSGTGPQDITPGIKRVKINLDYLTFSAGDLLNGTVHVEGNAFRHLKEVQVSLRGEVCVYFVANDGQRYWEKSGFFEDFDDLIKPGIQDVPRTPTESEGHSFEFQFVLPQNLPGSYRKDEHNFIEYTVNVLVKQEGVLSRTFREKKVFWIIESGIANAAPPILTVSRSFPALEMHGTLQKEVYKFGETIPVRVFIRNLHVRKSIDGILKLQLSQRSVLSIRNRTDQQTHVLQVRKIAVNVNPDDIFENIVDIPTNFRTDTIDDIDNTLNSIVCCSTTRNENVKVFHILRMVLIQGLASKVIELNLVLRN